MDLTFSLPIYILVVLYAFLGGAIKFIDQAYDEERYSRKLANLIAIVAGITMGGLMALDSPFSTAFYGAMILSLVLARKIDNRAFLAGTLIAALTLLVLWPVTGPEVLLVPLVVFILAGFLDEVVDGLAQKAKAPKIVRWAMLYRPLSDVALVAMMLLGWFPWYYLVPYFAFTFAYLAMERLSWIDTGSVMRDFLSRAISMIHIRP
jgi:hypothetical protein